MTDTAFVAVVVALLGLTVWREIRHDAERDKLLDRIQASTLAEYKAMQSSVVHEPVVMDDEREAEIEARRNGLIQG